MLDVQTRRRIDTARDILVGKVPDPKSQVEQITLALMYKFMDDIDALSEEHGGKASYFTGDFARYSWRKIVGRGVGAYETLDLYDEGLRRMGENQQLPVLFRQMFNNAYLPFRDPETLRGFLQVVGEFEYDNSERLGDAFEYLLSIMGSQGDAGQFRTPRHIIDFIVEILDPKKNESILDPACGTAGFLISAYRHIAKSNEESESPLTSDERKRLAESVRGYDISPDMVRLSLVNLYLHGFPDPDIFEYDTLTSEDRWGEYANVILANPPFMSPKGGIRPHNRFSVTSKRSEVLFVDYIAEHPTPDGRAGVIVPEGIIFQSQNAHKQLRKMLIDEYLVAVVSLPPGVFNPYSGVKTSVLILDKALAKRADTIGFFKVENDGFDLGAQRRPNDRNDLPRVVSEVVEYLRRLRDGDDVEGYVAELGLVVKKERIARDGEFNLSAERYRPITQIKGRYPCVRIQDICTVNPKKRELNGIYRDTEVSFLPMADLGENQMIVQPSQKRFLSEVSASYSYFADYDVLVARVTPCFENGKAGIATELTNGVGFDSSEFHVLRCRDRVLPQWIYACVTHPRFRDAAIKNMTGTGGLQRVPRRFVEDFAVPLPPLDVQREIVSEIEGYQKVISGARAVVENWCPRIAVDPEWPVVELGEVCEIVNGSTPSRKEPRYWDGEDVPWFTVNDIRKIGRRINRTHQSISETALSETSLRLLPPKTVLLCCTASVGEYAISEIPLTTNQQFNGLVVKQEFRPVLDPEFLFRMSAQFKDELIRLSGKTSFNFVSGRVLKRIRMPLPDLETQQTIARDLTAEQSLVDANVSLIERMEGKVREVVERVWGD